MEVNEKHQKAYFTRGALSLCLCVAGALVLATTAHATPISEIEGPLGNDTRATAQNVTPFFSPNTDTNVFGNPSDGRPILPTVSITGAISSTSDVDFYSFLGQSGATTYFDIDTAGLTLSDSVLSLFNSQGTLLALGDDSNPLDPGSTTPRNSFIGTYLLPANDTYFIAVTGFSRFPTAFETGTTSPLTRPDGGEGGDAYTGATPGDDSFLITDPTTDPTTGTYRLHISNSSVTAVPEPSTMLLMGLGMAGLAATRRRKNSKSETE